MRELFLYVINGVLNFVYPDKCIVCNKIVYDTSDFGICQNCIEDFYIFDDDICRNRFKTTGGFSMFLYEEAIRKIIHDFKYNDCGYYARVMGVKMGIFFMEKNLFSADLIVPVPIHKKRKRERGFNQADILAKEISRISGIPVIYNILKRKNNTKRQFNLTKDQRLENLKDAFEITDIKKLRGKRVLIIDDIYTTGATINECKRTIEKSGAGVKDIYYFTLAATIAKQ